ncbi:hypothetical protein ACQY0O_000238 [Thecaphora frezii]
MKLVNFVYASRYQGKLDVSFDLLLPDAPGQAAKPLPLLVWFHGGGLIQGSRNNVPPHIRRAVEKYDIAVISPDYRLAPQCRAPEILHDLADLLAFIFDDLPSALAHSEAEAQLDLNRVILSGSSAGGWLALLLGLGMCPGSRPELLAKIGGIACIYPITTMDHPFFLEKRVPFLGELPDPPSDFASFVDPDAEVTANTFDNKKRGSFYMHAQREGIFPSLLFSEEQRDEGWLQRTDVSVHVQAADESQRNGWPPIYIIHGALDTAVDVDQVRRLKAALNTAGTLIIYDEVPDKDHMWDEFEPEEEMSTFWSFVTDRFSATDLSTTFRI